MTPAPRSRAPVAAAIEFARALRELLQTTLLFRFAGSAAVARATTEAAKPLEAGSVAGAETTREELSRSLRAMRRAKTVWPAPVACLQSSLALRALYRRRGIPARLVVGIRMVSSELISHAWVDVDGIAIDDSRGTSGFEEFIGGAGRRRS